MVTTMTLPHTLLCKKYARRYEILARILHLTPECACYPACLEDGFYNEIQLVEIVNYKRKYYILSEAAKDSVDVKTYAAVIGA